MIITAHIVGSFSSVELMFLAMLLAEDVRIKHQT